MIVRERPILGDFCIYIHQPILGSYSEARKQSCFKVAKLPRWIWLHTAPVWELVQKCQQALVSIVTRETSRSRYPHHMIVYVVMLQDVVMTHKYFLFCHNFKFTCNSTKSIEMWLSFKPSSQCYNYYQFNGDGQRCMHYLIDYDHAPKDYSPV